MKQKKTVEEYEFGCERRERNKTPKREERLQWAKKTPMDEKDSNGRKKNSDGNRKKPYDGFHKSDAQTTQFERCVRLLI